MRSLLRKPRPAPRPAPRATAARRRRPRPASYYRAAGIDLCAEMERLCALPALGGPEGRLAGEPPELTVRRASRQPRSRLGFAVPAEHRISVTVYPGIRPADLLETLLHELVHIAVGPAAESRRWHGVTFTATLAAAMAEGYGVSGVGGPSARHGAYACAIAARLAAA
jgi:hypothetical protein